MPGTPGARTGLAAILTGDAATAFRTTTNAIIAWLEANATLTGSGLLADRPTSTPGSPGITGRKYYATDTGVEYRDTGTSWIALGVELVTTLPASPFNGQIVDYLADATNGVVWRLRYRAASASPYKWEFVGGSPLHGTDTTGGTRAGGAGFGNLTGTGVGPQITVPRAGDYEIAFGALVTNNSPGARVEVAIQVGAAAVSVDNTAAAAEDANAAISPWRQVRRTVTAPATAIALRYASSGGTANFSERELIVIPTRVG